jgi:hypothetical protein
MRYQNGFKELESYSKRMKISVMLKELQRIGRIEDPRKRVFAFGEFIPTLQIFAHETEDEKLIGVVQELAMAEERSRVFYEIESLLAHLEDLETFLEKVDQLVPNESIQAFWRCIKKFRESLTKPRRMTFSYVQNLYAVTKQVTRELIGRRLEKEIVPDLGKQLGYAECPNILPDNGKEIEVDYLGERDITTSPFGTGRLRRKEILIAECKTTISKRDILNFSKKVAIIKSKYTISASAFKYKLQFKVWIFSCYGWTEELKELAMKNNIEPFDKDAMAEILRRHKLLDRRIPICP